MNCPACGNPNRAGVRFCAKCGRPLPQQPAVAQPPQTPAYQPPPAPPHPAQVPPVAPAAQPPAAKPSTAARPIPWKSIGIGCAIYLLGMICGALMLAIGSWGVTELQKTSTPTVTTPSSKPGVISAPTTGPVPSAPAPTAAPPSIPPAPKPAAGERPPGFTLKDLNNQDKVFLDLIKDKSAVLVFWREEPRYDEMMNTLQSYTAKGLVVVAVLPESNVAAIKQRVEQRRWNQITMLINGESVAAQYNIAEYPTYFLIRRTCEIAERLGAGTQKPDLESKLNDLLK